MRLIQSVGDAFYRVVDNIGGQKDCKTCEAYREFLEVETQRSRYFEQLLLKRVGIIQSDTVQEDEQTLLPVVHRMASLSAIRRAAEQLKKNKKSDNPVADISELTEAERVFQEHLGDKINNG